MTWGMIGGAAVSVVGGALLNKNKGGGTTTSTTQQQVDPRIGNMLFGDGTKKLKAGAVPTGEDAYGRPTYDASAYEPTSQGLLSQYQDYLKQPQSAGLKAIGQGADAYLGSNATADQQAMRDAAYKAMGGINAPQMQAAQGSLGQTSALPTMQAASGTAAQSKAPANYTPAYGVLPQAMQGVNINAPNQNNMNLTGSYNQLINGDPGANPFLTGAIQKGINQSSNAFGNLQSDATRNLLENILPNLRSTAIGTGGYGGSREGIAEARALNDYSTQMGRAASQVGQNNTDAAVAAQAGAYNQDMANKLAATNSLGGLQYNVAGQNAANQQAANQQNYLGNLNMNQFNANAANQAAQTGYQGQLSTNQLNAQLAQQMAMGNMNNQQQANQLNFSGGLQNNQFNAQLGQNQNLANQGYQQAANSNNLQAQLGTNALNSGNLLSGMNALQGQFSNNYNMAQAQNNYDLNRAQQVNGLLSPYLGANSSTTQTQPYYQNTGSNILGGAVLGSQLFKNISNATNGLQTGNQTFGTSGGYEYYPSSYTGAPIYGGG